MLVDRYNPLVSQISQKMSVKEQKTISEFCAKAVYAAIQDLNDDSGETQGEGRYKSTITYQHYANLDKDNSGISKNELCSFTPLFSMSDGAKQILTMLWGKTLTEIKNIDLADGDNYISIISKLDEKYAESGFIHILKYCDDCKNYYPDGWLNKMTDKKDWFTENAKGFVGPQNKDYAALLVSRPFKSFLKTIARHIGIQVWYGNYKVVTKDHVLALLTTLGFPQGFIIELESDIKPKKVSKKKPSSPNKTGSVADAAANTADVTTGTSNSSTVNAAEANDKISDVEKIKEEIKLI